MRGTVEYLRIVPRRNWRVLLATLIGIGLVAVKDFEQVLDFLRDPTDPWANVTMMIIAAGILLALIIAVSEFGGSELISVERGELVVDRGIGPLRRVLRYKVNEIENLWGDAPMDQEDASGRPKPYQIFRKPTHGVVHFDYRGQETVYPAATLDDEQSGEAIARWLRGRLPRTATYNGW